LADESAPMENESLFVLPPVGPGRRRRARIDRRRRLIVITGASVAVALLAAGAVIAAVQLTDKPSKSAKASGSHSKSGASSTSTSGSKTTSGGTAPFVCASGKWPAVYQGQPKTLAGPSSPGVFLWNDPKGWHVRGVDKQGNSSFTIRVTASSLVAKYGLKTLPTSLKPTVSGNVVSVTFAGTADPRGFDFTMCDSTQFRVDVSAAPGVWSPDHTWIGANGVAPSNSLVVERTT
jgi:hypothetical protein